MAMATTPNTEALANPTYNPEFDASTLQLMNMMGGDYPPDVVAQYREAIMTLPTANPYTAVLANPRSCDISQAQTGLNEVRNAIGVRYTTVVVAGTPVPSLTQSGTGWVSAIAGQPGYQPTSQQAADAAAWQAAMPEMTANLDQADSTMADFQDHSDRLICNLPSIIGMVQTALGLATAIGNLLDPCLGIKDFLGSLLDKGSAIMAKINAAVQKVMSVINEALAEIQQAIAYVMGLIQSLIAMIEAEIMKLIKSLIDAARLGLAQLLSLLPKDPCFKAIMQSVATGAAVGVMSGVI
jgi:hypothetical protein